MDALHFDLLAKTLAQTGSRRWVVRLVAALPFGGVASLLSAETDAHRNRHQLRHRRVDHRARVHDEKKRKKRKKKKLAPSPPALPPTLPPPPSSPPPPGPPPPPTCPHTCA